MANPDQSSILFQNTYQENKKLCEKYQKDSGATNIEVESMLKVMINELKDKHKNNQALDLGNA